MSNFPEVDHTYSLKLSEERPRPSYSCKDCEKQSRSKRELAKHRSKVHNKFSGGNKQCLECPTNFYATERLVKHLKEVHKKDYELVQWKFRNESEFKVWKENYELNHNTRFVTHGKYLYCSRSGVFKSSSKGVRRLKSQGSAKSGVHCTAFVSLKRIGRSTELMATMCLQHYGHSEDLSHVPLTKIQRSLIAAKMKEGVSHEFILDRVRESLSDEAQRMQLLNKRDLWNIEQTFGLKNNVRLHENDRLSIKLWVESQDPTATPVLAYHDDDEQYLLAIMTQGQAQMLTNFGVGGIVCIAEAYGTRKCDFKLMTVLVVDEHYEGFPAAFCLAKKEDGDALTYFLESIKNRIGPVKAGLIMSDDTNQYYEAWNIVMGEGAEKVIGSWHAEQAWRVKLQSVADQMSRNEIYNLLKYLQLEKSMEVFQDMLPKITSDISELDEMFAKYFVKFYVSRPDEWAHCFRDQSVVNASTNLGTLCTAIQNHFRKGVKFRRIDECFHLLLKVARDYQFDRISKITLGKQTHLVNEIKKQHKKSKLIPRELLYQKEEKMWIIASSRDCYSEYTVEKASSCVGCPFRCAKCHSCFHEYRCSCPDFFINGIMCKHIHLVATLEQPSFSDSSDSVAEGQEWESSSHLPQQFPVMNQAKLELRNLYLKLGQNIETAQLTPDLVNSVKQRMHGLCALLSAPRLE